MKAQWRWRSKQVFVLAVIITLVPLPVLAGEGTQPTPTKQTLSATAAKVVAREVAKSVSDEQEAARSGVLARTSAAYAGVGAPLATARAEQEGTPGTRSGAFFKTPAGIAVLAVLGAGVGYALYSAQHDRVHSAGKK